LELDSITTPIVTYPQYFDLNGIEYLSTINVIDNSIKIFELNSRKSFKTISFDSDGPNRLTDLLSFHIINQDSLFYLDKIGNLYLLDSNSSILNRWRAKDHNEKGQPLFYDNILPITGDFKKQVIFPNYYTTQIDRKLFFILDFENNQFTYKVAPPEEYVNGFYGVGDFGNWNFIENNDGYILNFPNINEIFHYDKQLNFVKKIELKIDGPTIDIVNPLPKNFDLSNASQLNEKEIEGKLKSSYVYGYLLFDRKSEKFIRFLKYPIPPSSQNSNDVVTRNERKYSILIFDKNFDFIKEMKIPFDEYLINEIGFFVKDGFLYLQKKSLDEDIMIFDAISLL
jgi:hypothetical protein